VLPQADRRVHHTYLQTIEIAHSVSEKKRTNCGALQLRETETNFDNFLVEKDGTLSEIELVFRDQRISITFLDFMQFDWRRRK